VWRGRAGRALAVGALLAGLAVPAAHAADGAEAWWKAAREKAGRYPVRTKLVDAAGRPTHVNALILERSPYLLQHAHDPVRWQAWSDDVLARARRENRLIFLSIGYSSCHWCHVMARESFDDEAIGRLLNASYVSVKVDREEYPDLDERFMKRLALLTGSAGWPGNLILTPAGDVVAGDSYLPPARLGAVLTRMAQAWQRRPEQVRRLAATVEGQFKPREPGPAVDLAALRDATLAAVRRQYDPVHHGFGTAPKFPNAPYLELLLDAYRRAGRDDDRRMIVDTLRAVARSALHDHLAGGFFRYSIQADWQRPHFEKTLYDQALLATLLAEAWTLSGEPIFASATERTLGFVERTMRTPEGLFASALDADSGGRDGGHYLWTAADLDGRLDAGERAALEGAYRRVEQERGTFLLVPRDGVEPPRGLAGKLGAVRDRRPPPFVDGKAITSWNALMIEALARSGRMLGHARLIDSAASTMRRLLAGNTAGGRVYRYSIEAHARLPASPEDTAYLLRALAALHEIEGSPFWLEQADAVARALPDGAALAAQLRDGSQDRHLPAPGAALLSAIRRLARQRGTLWYREKTDEVAAHLRAALAIDATDQATSIAALYDLDHAAPVRTAFLADGHVRAEISTHRRVGDATELEVTIRIDPRWHINGARPLRSDLSPTRVDGERGATVDVAYPPAREVTLRVAGGPVAVYEGTVRLGVRVHGAAGVGTPLKLSLQACSESVCLLPETIGLFR
jgi:hypothetical protein